MSRIPLYDYIDSDVGVSRVKPSARLPFDANAILLNDSEYKAIVLDDVAYRAKMSHPVRRRAKTYAKCAKSCTGVGHGVSGYTRCAKKVGCTKKTGVILRGDVKYANGRKMTASKIHRDAAGRRIITWVQRKA